MNGPEQADKMKIKKAFMVRLFKGIVGALVIYPLLPFYVGWECFKNNEFPWD